MDLDIKNYELADILNLFKIPVLFGDKHLREAKVIICKCIPISHVFQKNIFYFLPKHIRCYTRFIKFDSRMRKIQRNGIFI